MKSTYFNTDLDIVSPGDLSELVHILDEKCDLLYGKKEEDGLWHICVEACGSGLVGSDEHDLQKDVGELLKVIEELSEEKRNLLHAVSKFDFNIGWQASEKRHESTFNLTNELLRRISDVGATLTVTIYPPDENDFED